MKKPLLILVIVFAVLLVGAIALLVCLETGLIPTASQSAEQTTPSETENETDPSGTGTTAPQGSQSGETTSATHATEDPESAAPEFTLPLAPVPGTQPDPTGPSTEPDPDENETPHMEF